MVGGMGVSAPAFTKKALEPDLLEWQRGTHGGSGGGDATVPPFSATFPAGAEAQVGLDRQVRAFRRVCPGLPLEVSLPGPLQG